MAPTTFQFTSINFDRTFQRGARLRGSKEVKRTSYSGERLPDCPESPSSGYVLRLAGAVSAIYVSMWCLTNVQIVNTSLAAKDRKVERYFVGDKKQLRKHKNKETADKFEAAKIPIKVVGNENKLLHHNFCFIDGKTLLHGSFNWSEHAPSNVENVVVSPSRKLIALFMDEFKYWFSKAEVYDSSAPAVVQPQFGS